VEMIGFLGMGTNPMVGATVAVSVAVAEAVKKGSETNGKRQRGRRAPPPRPVKKTAHTRVFLI
jgi:hypothetical protein